MKTQRVVNKGIWFFGKVNVSKLFNFPFLTFWVFLCDIIYLLKTGEGAWSPDPVLTYL